MKLGTFKPGSPPPAAMLALAALLAAGCLEVADGRARLDLDVGHVEGAVGRIDVADGLAVVHAPAPGEIRLWAQAPAFSFTLSPRAGDGTPLSITIDNVLADAVLSGAAADGTPLLVELVETPRPTLKRWTVARPSDVPLTFTVTAPDAADLGPWRFAVFADVQEAIPNVHDIFERMNLDPDLRFALIAGDLTERGTVDELEHFQRELRTLRIPCYATLGNHELGTSEGSFQQRYGRGSFHFAFRGVHFTLLDSASATLSPLVSGWLDDWLSQGALAPHVVAMHIPPLDPTGIRNGAFASRGEASALLARFAAAHVDVTFYGHVHTYRAFSHAGIPAFISGGGGAIPERFDGVGRHYLAVELDPDSARLETTLVRVYPE